MNSSIVLKIVTDFRVEMSVLKVMHSSIFCEIPFSVKKVALNEDLIIITIVIGHEKKCKKVSKKFTLTHLWQTGRFQVSAWSSRALCSFRAPASNIASP